jgi:putative heme-binding domain-containing protein
VPPAALLAQAHEGHPGSAELRAAIREALGGSAEATAAAVLARLCAAEAKRRPSQGQPAVGHRLPELLAYLESPAGRGGDVQSGRAVFKKARCLDCHTHGRAGGDMGPDLTTVARRFSRRHILEAIIEPSKDIAPQYRATTLVTTKGVSVTSLVTPCKDVLSVLQGDGVRVTVREKDVEERFPSSISLMPEGLLNALRREEIRDLFAFLESSPD